MKNSKRYPSSSAEKKNAGKKSSARKAGFAKLDRKSSRGMIYENEELRLRTININAEVERGQSDIRKLRRENEQLRREIWTLRDEYDRLNKRFKANKYLPDGISQHGQSESNSEDSDSCDTCRGEGDSNDECLSGKKQLMDHRDSPKQLDSYSPSHYKDAATSEGVKAYDRSGSTREPTFETQDLATKPCDNLHVLCDHLSIVSEENLSNSDGNLTQADVLNQSQSYCLGAMSLHSVVGPSTPLTPIELVANQLNDLQTIIPPLSYFENIVKQHSAIESTASINTVDTVIQTNGWDYNIQSPFSAKKFHTSETSSSNSTPTTKSPSHVNNPVTVSIQKESTPQPEVSTNPNSGCADGNKPKPHKHFFSPIKPRLKLDTSLAAKASILTPPTVLYPEIAQPKYDPPDMYITNALASPYYPQANEGLFIPPVLMPPVQQALSNIEPIYATAQKKSRPSDQSQTGGESSKSSVNLEQILNEIGTITDDILQLQLEKSMSREHILNDNQYVPPINCSGVIHGEIASTKTQTMSPNTSPTNQSLLSDKNPPLVKGGVAYEECSSTQATAFNTVLDLKADEGEPDRQGTSPSPPQLPTPMAPFSTNLMYLAFDRLNPALSESVNSARYGLVGGSQQPQPKPTPPPPPLPTQLSFAYHDQSDTAIGLRIRDQAARNPTLTLSSPELSTSPLETSSPLKQRLFKNEHNDLSSLHQITRSFDGSDVPTTREGSKTTEPNEVAKLKTALEESVNEISSYESSSGSEPTKRKSSRRVSIFCQDDNKVDQTEANDRHHQQNQSTVSVDRLVDIMPAMLGTQKHARSTPNSPHSNRRRGNTSSAISAVSGSSTLHHHGHHHHHHHHHHTRKFSQESIHEATPGARTVSVSNSIVNSTPENVGATTSPQHMPRYKCSRRHSDGTVNSTMDGGGAISTVTNLRISGTSNHHHHHHHIDSTHETATSISERNSGSLASSRESSTSLSMRSQRRKISVSSHTGGKIPWCGCWGNGCL